MIRFLLVCILSYVLQLSITCYLIDHVKDRSLYGYEYIVYEPYNYLSSLSILYKDEFKYYGLLIPAAQRSSVDSGHITIHDRYGTIFRCVRYKDR